jgi:hypothetical protein
MNARRRYSEKSEFDLHQLFYVFFSLGFFLVHPDIKKWRVVITLEVIKGVE